MRINDNAWLPEASCFPTAKATPGQCRLVKAQ
jgi:hypothetical protein